MVERLVSVIIPAHNYAHYLSECINSVLKQSYPDWEAIIVDDGSTDNTEEVALELKALSPDRIQYHKTQNLGVAAARNFACKLSRGEFILPLDADDLLSFDAIERFVAALSTSDTLGYAYSAVENYEALPGQEFAWRPGPFYRRWMTEENLAACTSLWRRSLWEDGVCYRELIFEDWDLFLQIIAKGYDGVYIPYPLLRYRQHPSGRHSINRHMYFLAYFQNATKNPSLYDQATSVTGELLLQNVPGCLKKPTIVFLPDPDTIDFFDLSGLMLELAEYYVSHGHFVAAVGNLDDISLIQKGIALVKVLQGATIEEVASRLGMLGNNLVLISSFPSQASTRFRSAPNVRTIVSLHDKFDSHATHNLSYLNGEYFLHGNAEGLLAASPSRSLPETASEILASHELLTQEHEKQQDQFATKLKSLSRADREFFSSLAEKDLTKDSLGIVIALRNYSPVKLKYCLAALRVAAPELPVLLCYYGLKADYPAALDQICKHYSVKLLVIESSNPWARSHANNIALKMMETKWTMFLNPSSLLAPHFLKLWRKYVNDLGESVYFKSEARLLSSLSQALLMQSDPDNKAFTCFRDLYKKAYRSRELKSSVSILPTEWFKEVGGFIEDFLEEGIPEEELDYRTSLAGLRTVWLPSESIIKQWGINRSAREWYGRNSGYFRSFKVLPRVSSNQKDWGRPDRVLLDEDSFDLPDQRQIDACFSLANQVEAKLITNVDSQDLHIETLMQWGNHALNFSQDISAGQAFEDVLSIKDSYAPALSGLAKVFLQRGSVPLAGHFATLALEQSPELVEAQQILKALEEHVNAAR